MTAFEPLPTLRARPNFRLGVTSYVYPADLLTNVRQLAGAVDDIEVVLFESSDVSNLPTPADIEALRALAAAHNMTFTVHFPIDRQLGSAARETRQNLRDQILKIMALTHPLKPYGYILHMEGVQPDATAARVAEWQRDVQALLPELVAQAERPDLFCVENLDYPFEWCEPFLDRHGLAVCMDVGHLWRRGRDAAQHWDRYRERIRVVHLHGVRGERDHLALDVLAPADLRAFLRAINGFQGVVTLEGFEREAVARSLRCLENTLTNRV